MSRVLFLVFWFFQFVVAGIASERLIVFAPASLTEVMAAVGARYEHNHGQKVIFSVAGTSQLARQLDAGAPAHIFISADQGWMDWVEKHGLIKANSRFIFASNRLVLAVRQETENWADIEALLTQFPFSMGEPGSVPIGKYAREALGAKGWWEAAKQQAVFSENTRVTLRRLALGEVGAAIVYATDVAVEPAVKTLITFPPETHSPIAYWAAATVHRQQGVENFMKFLTSPAAGEIFAAAGFVPPPENP